jgi:hypothetical protein
MATGACGIHCDDEFPAALSVLFDESVEAHLKADAIWGLATLVSDALFNVT